MTDDITKDVERTEGGKTRTGKSEIEKDKGVVKTVKRWVVEGVGGGVEEWVGIAGGALVFLFITLAHENKKMWNSLQVIKDNYTDAALLCN